MAEKDLSLEGGQLVSATVKRAQPGFASLRTGRWLDRLVLLVTLTAIAGGAIREVVDPDLWWHLATGRYIVAQRRIPTADVFSFTAATHRWVTHEWLSDLLLYGGYRLVGFAGLVFLFALLITTAFALVYQRCRSRPTLAACSVLLAAIASRVTWGVRPQMFTLFLSSLYLYILDREERSGSTGLWLLPPLTLLWANLHSGFVAGLVIIAVYALGREIQWLARRAGQGSWIGPGVGRLALAGLLSAGCSLITPNGVSVVLFPFGTLGNHLIQANIEEWFSPNFHEPMFWPLAAYWLALLGVLALSPRRARATEFLLLVGAAGVSLYSARHTPFLSLVGAPVLASQAEEMRPRAAGRRVCLPVIQVALVLSQVALGAVLGMRAYTVVRDNGNPPLTGYPAAAVAYLREHGIGGRIFNTYHWGGYLIWQGYPVFIDGRAELYGDEVLGEYLKVQAVKPDWESPLRRYGVEVVLIEADSRLAVVLQESGRWQAVYRDGLATVFVPARPRLAP